MTKKSQKLHSKKEEYLYKQDLFFKNLQSSKASSLIDQIYHGCGKSDRFYSLEELKKIQKKGII